MAARVAVRTPALKDRYDLLNLGLQCLDILVLDDLWNEAVGAKNPLSRDIGVQLIDELKVVSERSGWARKVISNSRDELNAYWPTLRDRFIPAANVEIKEFDRWLNEYDGLGNAGDAVLASLREVLGHESKSLSEKVAKLDMPGVSEGDLEISTRVLLGVVVVCCLLTVALPIVAASVGAAGVTAGSISGIAALAGVGAGIAGGALVHAKGNVKVPQPAPPTQSPPPTSPEGTTA